MPVGACRQLVGSSSECPSESVGSLSAACRQPVGSLSGGPVGVLREPVRACRSMSEPSELVRACRALSRSMSERHKVNFPGEIYFVGNRNATK